MASEDNSRKYLAIFPEEFLSDIKKLDKREKEEVSKQVDKIAQNPEHFKHLHGKGNCYTVRAGNIRIVYSLEGENIRFLVAERRKDVYAIYRKRLFAVHERL